MKNFFAIIIIMANILKLKEKKHEYGEVYTFVFEPLDSVKFCAGQFCHLSIPDMPLFSRSLRKISFASCPSDNNLVFSINMASGKMWHKHMKALKIGDEIRILGRLGHGSITFPEDTEKPVVCIAGGVGATSFRSLIRHDIINKTGRNITFIHVATNGHLYEKEFLKYPITRYLIERRDIDGTLMQVVPKHIENNFLITGSPEFVMAIARKLVLMGVSAKNIKGHKLRKIRLKNTPLKK
jgi:NAD(P)H-flavin reductase